LCCKNKEVTYQNKLNEETYQKWVLVLVLVLELELVLVLVLAKGGTLPKLRVKKYKVCWIKFVEYKKYKKYKKYK